MSIYDSLNDKQREATFHTEGPLLILAGAGSGKTRVLTHRIAYLIEEKQVNPYNIMAITFTNKAAKEMRERVDAIVGYGSESIWVSTFHSTCVRFLRRFIDRLGYGTNFTIYDPDDTKSIVKDIVKRMNLDPKMYKEKAILNQISRAKDELIGPDEMLIRAGGDYAARKIGEIYRQYQEQLKKNNALDFDDLIFLTVELFTEHRDVLEYYQDRFKYIMVDEYQDTNTAQFKLVSLLAGKYRNLCVVGDDDQSIYKFRGANISNILDFEDTYTNAKVIKLEQNYRSTQTILDAANGVIKNNFGRKDKALWTDKGAGDKIRLVTYDNGIEEAIGVVEDITNKVLNEGYSYKDCAVLYRTNAQSRALEERFITANIPYRVYGGVNFYQRKEIKDILAYLKTIDNGRDDVAVKRILNVPKRGIGATTVARVETYAIEREINFFDALDMSEDVPAIGKAAAKIETFVEYISVLRSKAKVMKISELIPEIVESCGYDKLIEESDDEDEIADRKANIDEFITKAVTYEEGTDEPNLSEFLEEVALIADIDNMDESVNRVSLMTFHSAKGLEFPSVYMTGMEDGLFPGYLTIANGDIEDMEEERRLCYVGITRAMKSLMLCNARQRMIRGETQYNQLSRFIKEIPPLLLEKSQRGFMTGMGSRQGEGSEFGKSSFEKSPLSENGFNKTGFTRNSLEDDVFDVKKKTNTDYGTSSYGGKSPSRASSTSYSSGATKVPGVVKLSRLTYEVGDRVNHFRFGDGKVLNIIEGPRDYEVTVDFDDMGVKKMFASFAKLQKK